MSNLYFNWQEILSAFVVLFALIDVFGSVPIFINFKSKGKDVNPTQSASYSFIIFVIFLFVGQWVLGLFNVDLSSFAVAGALVILIISIEMIFGIEMFRNDAPKGASTFVPIVFPLITGPGTFTALLSMRAEFNVINIIIALFFNMVIVFVVLRNLKHVERIIGVGGIYVMRKFFGIILMAIAVRLFTTNLAILLHTFAK